jgi:hypothetical protein
MTFALKGYKGETVGTYVSCTKLEIRGRLTSQGRQPESEVPIEVIELLKKYPEIESISLSMENSGTIYSR